MFILFIIMSIVNIITCISLVYFAMKKHKNFIISQLAFIITMVLMMQSVSFDVNHWLKINDISALMDVYPTLSNILFCYSIAVMVINIIASMTYYKKN